MEQAKSRQSALILIGTLLSKLMSMAAVLTVSHRMGSEAIGLVAGAYALVGIFRFVFDAGLPTTHIKKISEGADPAGCVGAYLRLKVITTALGILVVGVAIPIFLWLSDAYAAESFLPVVLIILVARSINSVVLVPHATFTGTGQIAKKQIIQIVQSASDCLFVILVALFLQDVLFLAVAHLVSECISATVTYRLFRGQPIAKPAPGVMKNYVRFSLPLIGTALTESLYSHVDRLMLMTFISASVVGYYHSAWRVIAFVLMIPTAVSTILMPAASRYLANRQWAESGRIMLKAERYLSMTVAPICAGMAIFSPWIMQIFGAEFIAGALSLSVLSAVCFLYSVNRASAAMLISLGKTATIFRMTLVLVIINVLLNAVLIPQSLWGVRMAGLGAFGAAIATLVAALGGFVATKVIVYRATGAGINRSVALHPVAAVVSGWAAWACVGQILSPDLLPVLYAAVGGLILLIVYAFALFMVGELGSTEIGYVAKAMNPKSLLSDVRRELAHPDRRPPVATAETTP